MPKTWRFLSKALVPECLCRRKVVANDQRALCRVGGQIRAGLEKCVGLCVRIVQFSVALRPFPVSDEEADGKRKAPQSR